jgi:hypothetical protein
MKLIDTRTHGYLDYLTVLVFLLAPLLLGFGGAAAVLSYLVAACYLAVSLLTAYPLGVRGLIPLRTHGFIDLSAAPLLVLLPWIFGFAAVVAARNFFMVLGVITFVVWLLTDYEGELDHPVVQ